MTLKNGNQKIFDPFIDCQSKELFLHDLKGLIGAKMFSQLVKISVCVLSVQTEKDCPPWLLECDGKIFPPFN